MQINMVHVFAVILYFTFRSTVLVPAYELTFKLSELNLFGPIPHVLAGFVDLKYLRFRV